MKPSKFNIYFSLGFILLNLLVIPWLGIPFAVGGIAVWLVVLFFDVKRYRQEKKTLAELEVFWAEWRNKV